MGSTDPEAPLCTFAVSNWATLGVLTSACAPEEVSSCGLLSIHVKVLNLFHPRSWVDDDMNRLHSAKGNSICLFMCI
jgi:hypothetical protein